VEESWCDWCQQQGEEAKAAVARAGEEQRRDKGAVAEQAQQRAVPQSRRVRQVREQAEWRVMQRWIKYPSNVVCYKCGVGKVICQPAVEGRWAGSGGRVQGLSVFWDIDRRSSGN
jgi:hypothetical protein